MFSKDYFQSYPRSFITFLFLLFLSNNINSQEIDFIKPSCELPPEKSFYDLGTKDLKVDIKFNYRKYVREIFKMIIKEKAYEKKWIKATLNIKNINNEIICDYKAEIRILGDNLDHISIKTPPISSLVVELKDGSLFGITRFNLFLPVTRYDKNELFSSMLYKELGFLSPRTSFIETLINGSSQKYIFQESLEKEFLEFNKKIEGPLFEGDERFGLGEEISFTKLVNPKWSQKNENAYLITLASMEVMNNSYVETSRLINNIFDPVLSIYKYGFHPNDLEGKAILEEFYALSYAINGFTGLSRDDSRYYFNSVFGRFEPIYYDMHPQPNLELQYQKVPSFLKARIELLKQRLLNINKQSFALKLEKIGAKYTFNDMISVFLQIEKNLDILKTLPVINIPDFNDTDNFSLISESEFFENFGGFLFILNDGNNWRMCDYQLIDCSFINLLPTQIYDALRQKLIDKDGKHIIFVGTTDLSDKIIGLTEYPYSIMHWDSYNIDDDSILRVTKGIKIDLIREEKKLYLNFNNELDQAIIYGGSLEDWHISIAKNISEPTNNQHIKFYKSGLTGCLNIHDIEISNIIINSFNLGCEDSVNLLRVKGTIKEVSIKASSSDALDIDFSNLLIKKLKISNAGNDCVDLSGGNYRLENVNIYDCGDKGISVGEKSNLIADKVNIYKAKIGLSIKDSSTSEINKINIVGTDLCFAAYRKKQEYGGSKLFINESECSSGKYYQQKNSSIIFGKENRFTKKVKEMSDINMIKGYRR